MKKIVLLGGSGFIGMALARALAGNFPVVAAYSANNPAESGTFQEKELRGGLQKVRWEKLDITDGASLLEFLGSCRPDIIINCVSLHVERCQEEPEKCRLVNVLPTKAIVAHYLKMKPSAKYIFFSSSQVFNGAGGRLHTEQEKPNPLNVYGKVKAEAENIVRMLPDYAIVRPCLVYGLPLLFQHRTIINHLYKALRRGETFTAYTDMVRSPCYVKDVAELVKAIIVQRKKGIFHAGGKAMSMYDFARAAAEGLGLDPRLVTGESSGGKEKPYKPLNTALDSSFSRRELGVVFTPLAEAMQEIRAELEGREAEEKKAAGQVRREKQGGNE